MTVAKMHGGFSGSLVLRTIDVRVPWAKLERELEKFYAAKQSQGGGGGGVLCRYDWSL